jgi:hypothetical protein
MDNFKSYSASTSGRLRGCLRPAARRLCTTPTGATVANCHHGLQILNASFPEGADREGEDSVAEGEWAWSGVEHCAGQEAIAELVAQPLQVLGVSWCSAPRLVIWLPGVVPFALGVSPSPPAAPRAAQRGVHRAYDCGNAPRPHHQTTAFRQSLVLAFATFWCRVSPGPAERGLQIECQFDSWGPGLHTDLLA